MMPYGASRVATVLLVGSAQDDRAMYAEYLRAAGHRVIEIESAAEALALAITADVVVTGIRVPGPFDGIELVRRLRSDEATKAKAIVVLTGCVFESDERRARAAGCDAFVPKPCYPETLVEHIQRAFLHRSGIANTNQQVPNASGGSTGDRRNGAL
jgi:two-component system, cell cycle response regulator DivK